MNNELLILIRRQTYTLIVQTKSKSRERLEFKLNKQFETSSFSPLINLSEDKKWLLAVTSFDATNSVFIKTKENKIFSASSPGFWSSRGGAEIRNKLQKLLKMRHNNDIQVHVEEFRNKEKQLKTGDNECNIFDLNTRKNEMNKKFKKRRI